MVRHKDQWNRTVSPEIKLYSLWSTGFYQGCQDHSLGERKVSLTTGAGTTGFPYVEKWWWPLILHHIQQWTQNGSKTSVRAKYKSFIDIRLNLYDLEFHNEFLHMTPKCIPKQQQKLDFLEMKNF